MENIQRSVWFWSLIINFGSKNAQFRSKMNRSLFQKNGIKIAFIYRNWLDTFQNSRVLSKNRNSVQKSPCWVLNDLISSHIFGWKSKFRSKRWQNRNQRRSYVITNRCNSTKLTKYLKIARIFLEFTTWILPWPQKPLSVLLLSSFSNSWWLFSPKISSLR